MSYSICLNIWLDKAESVEDYLSVLRGVSQACLAYKRSSSLFYQIQLFDRRFSKVADFATKRGDLAEVCSYFKQRWSKTYHAWIEFMYPYLLYDEELDSVIETQTSATVQLNGVDYDEGYQTKRFGHVEITFDNINSFLLPHKLIVKVARADSNRNSIKWRAMIAQIGRNYDYVRNVIKTVIAEAQPRHLLSCTESDVNPLVAHDIYHSRLEDFGTDVLKIAKLHEYGGAYFTDVQPDDRAFFPPWKKDDYGYWRGHYGRNSTAELIAKLQPYVDRILRAPHSIEISSTTIEECLLSSLSTQAERIGESYLLSSRASSMDYIEEPYFCLFERLSTKP